jgi:hypothetical protein
MLSFVGAECLHRRLDNRRCITDEDIWLSSSFFVSLGGVEPSPLLLRPLNGLLYHLRMMMNDNECGAIGGVPRKGNS